MWIWMWVYVYKYVTTCVGEVVWPLGACGCCLEGFRRQLWCVPYSSSTRVEHVCVYFLCSSHNTHRLAPDRLWDSLHCLRRTRARARTHTHTHCAKGGYSTGYTFLGSPSSYIAASPLPYSLSSQWLSCCLNKAR